MANTSRTTTDHDDIRTWAEQRGGRPATVAATHDEDDVGIIRIDFPGYSGGESLEVISWDEWFEEFEDSGLAIVLQDHTADGEESSFNRLVNRD